jgi:DNA-directed RNA polymerase specialized sigma24 family protein
MRNKQKTREQIIAKLTNDRQRLTSDQREFAGHNVGLAYWLARMTRKWWAWCLDRDEAVSECMLVLCLASKRYIEQKIEATFSRYTLGCAINHWKHFIRDMDAMKRIGSANIKRRGTADSRLLSIHGSAPGEIEALINTLQCPEVDEEWLVSVHERVDKFIKILSPKQREFCMAYLETGVLADAAKIYTGVARSSDIIKQAKKSFDAQESAARLYSDRDRDDIRICNCAGCNHELLARSEAEWFKKLKPKTRDRLPPLVCGIVEDRPYCNPCYLDRFEIYTLGRFTQKQFDILKSYIESASLADTAKLLKMSNKGVCNIINSIKHTWATENLGPLPTIFTLKNSIRYRLKGGVGSEYEPLTDFCLSSLVSTSRIEAASKRGRG